MFPKSSVGRKIFMAATGQFMIIYVLAHVLGNSTIYFSAINAYAEGLRHWPYVPVLWASRGLLLVSIVLHGYCGLVTRLENRKARPAGYARTDYRRATFAGRNMIWTGAVIGAFLAYHLSHFTFQVTDRDLSALSHPDALGRPDVFIMVVGSFRKPLISGLYLIGVLALGLHLLHGIQSSLQTWGMTTDRSLPMVEKSGTIASLLLFLGYAAIPLVIAAGIVQ